MTRVASTICWAALATFSASGCGPGMSEWDYPDIQLVRSEAILTFTVQQSVYGLLDERPEAWTYVQYPELTPVEALITVTPTVGGDLSHRVRVVPEGGVDYARWHAVLYEGDASPRSNGWRWAPSHWIWRVGPPPPVQPRSIRIQGDEIFVELMGRIQPPTDTSLVSMTSEQGAVCATDFWVALERYLYFNCSPNLIPPTRVTIDFREGLEDDEGVPIPPGTFSVDLIGDYANFDLPGPPPIPAERCAEGYNYPSTDTNCQG